MRDGRWIAPSLCCLTAAARRALGHLGRALGAPDLRAGRCARRAPCGSGFSQWLEPLERAVAASAGEAYGRSCWGLQRAVVEDMEVADDGTVVVVGPPEGMGADRCPRCRRRCRAMTGARDVGAGERWIWARPSAIGRRAPRVSCREHGVVVAAVP